MPSNIVAATSTLAKRMIHLRCSAVVQTVRSRLANTPSRRLSAGSSLADSNIARTSSAPISSTGRSPTRRSRNTGSSGPAKRCPRRTVWPSNSARTTYSGCAATAKPSGITISGLSPRSISRDRPYSIVAGAIVAMTTRSSAIWRATAWTAPSECSAALIRATPSACFGSRPGSDVQMQRTSLGATIAMTVASPSIAINSDSGAPPCHWPSTTRQTAGSSASFPGKRVTISVIPVRPSCARERAQAQGWRRSSPRPAAQVRQATRRFPKGNICSSV